MAEDTITDETEVEEIEVEVLEFSAPAKKAARPEIPLQLVGETYTARAPKDAVMFMAEAAIADTAGEADRWMATIQIVNTMLTDQGRHRFWQRVVDRDDPLTQGAVMEALEALFKRWAPSSKVPDTVPVIIDAHPDRLADIGLKPVKIVNADLDLDLVCYPPKDIALGVVAASMATGASNAQQAWSVNLFLDAALPLGQAQILSHRLRDSRDDLDLEHLAQITRTLIDRWYGDAPKPNRAARRAAASKSKGKGSTSRKKG